MNAQQMNTNRTNYSPRTYGLAIASLVLSITGMLPILPVIGSIAGIVTGNIARKEIKTHPDWYTGEGVAKAGIILGWIGIGLFILGVVAVLLFLAPVRTISSGPLPAIQVTLQP